MTAAHDQFHIYEDGSAVVNSMHGTAYDLRFFTNAHRPGGRYTVPHCGCEASKNPKKVCRHRRKLKARLDADGRIGAVYHSFEILDDDAMPVRIETECAGCGEYVVDCWIYCRRSKEVRSGFLHLFVCGCADWRAKGRQGAGRAT